MRLLKNRIFIFILGGIFFSSITALAVSSISAHEITYTNQNNIETPVDEVLDDLYTIANTAEVSVIAPANMRYAIIEDKNYNYFSVSLTDNGSGATCTAYRANVATKTGDITYNTDYSTDDEANRIYFKTAGSYCQYKVTYHN